MVTLLKLEFYVPDSHLEAVKTAMFAEGGGRVGNYDSCAWQTAGQGQYRPLAGSAPFHGQTGKVEKVAEYKVEMVCSEDRLQPVIAALKATHPYEEVAFSVMRMEDIG